MRKLLSALGFLLFLPNYSFGASLGPFLNSGDGTPSRVWHASQAQDMCKNRGTRLPTSKEYAEYESRYGALIVEAKDYDSGKLPQGSLKDDFAHVMALNGDGTKDEFYLSVKKFTGRAQTEETVWTDSQDYTDEYYSRSPSRYQWSWFSLGGLIDDVTQYYGAGKVRCIEK